MKRLLITGGSGFIGTNLVEFFLHKGCEVLNIDIKKPQNRDHHKVFTNVDIRDRDSLLEAFRSFAPTHVVHLAARADLHETKDASYDTNIQGVENMVRTVTEQPSVERCIFTSTKLVCPTDYRPRSMDDYCPNTLYGESKVEGEKIVKSDTTMKCDWCIVRPTSIWGPWSMLPHIPYGKFFVMLARGRYFHPGHTNPPKSFGYVGNAVFQIEKLLNAPREEMHRQIFYLSDYATFAIRDWANSISMQLRGKKVHTIPEPLVRLFALCGDVLKQCGVKEPPFSSFRMRNMQANTSRVPMEPTERITGPLPYSMQQGVEDTITWFKKYDLI